MEQKRIVVPWQCRAEWSNVSRLLCSDTVKDLVEALSWIEVWNLRMQKLPLAVSVTEWLYRPYVADLFTRSGDVNGYGLHSPSGLLMMYSCGIVRFVNYVNELGQKGKSVQPVHVSVKKFGIPKWVVELRHKATHQELPSLAQCRWASEFCRHWILENYWKLKQISDACTSQNGVGDKRNRFAALQDEVQNAIAAYVNVRRKLRKSVMKASLKLRLQVRQKKVLKRVKKLALSDRRSLLCFLITNENFILTSQALKESNLSNEAFRNDVPDLFSTTWTPLLDVLFEHQLAVQFVNAILQQIPFASGVESAQLLAWLLFALRKISKELQPFDWVTAIERIMTLAPVPDWMLIESVLKLAVPSLDSMKVQKLHKLHELYLGSSTSLSEPLSSAYELQTCVSSMKSVQETVANSEAAGLEARWKLAERVSWSQLPLGCTLVNGCATEDFSLLVLSNDNQAVGC